jgi:hypothetical protein
MVRSEAKPSEGTITTVRPLRLIGSGVFAAAFGATFSYLSFECHHAVWNKLAPPDTIIEGTAFLSIAEYIMGVMAAGVFGAAGLCIAPLCERLYLGRIEYSSRYGPIRSCIYYPWKIYQVRSSLLSIGPIFAIFFGWYMCDGYEISSTTINVRQGPFDSFHQIGWNQVKSIKISCYRDQKGFKQNFNLVTNLVNIDLGYENFDDIVVTPSIYRLAKIIIRYQIHEADSDIDPGCNSADVKVIVNATNYKKP